MGADRWLMLNVICLPFMLCRQWQEYSRHAYESQFAAWALSPQQAGLHVCCLKSVAGTARATILLQIMQAAWPVRSLTACNGCLLQMLVLQVSNLQLCARSLEA